MPSCGTELCGQVVFGGDPLWADAEAAASGQALSVAPGVRRLPQFAALVFATGRADVSARRVPLLSAALAGSSVGLCRFVHLVSVLGGAPGSAESAARIRRLVQHAVRGSGRAVVRDGMQRLVQVAAVTEGEAVFEVLFRRCPQFRSGVTGIARAWFLSITVMGGAAQRGGIQRIVQHAGEASMPAAQASFLMRISQGMGLAEGRASCGGRASLRPAMRGAVRGRSVRAGRLIGFWTLRAAAKAQVKVEGSPAVRVSFHPLPGVCGTAARCDARALTFGIGPALVFSATAPESGVILFEVET